MIRLRISLVVLLAWSTITQWMFSMDRSSVIVVSSFTTTTTLSSLEHACRQYPKQRQRQQQHDNNRIQHVLSSNMIGGGVRISGSISSCSSNTLHMLPYDISSVSASSTLWTSVVEYFDGSTIIDPVVVSNVFWSKLQANFISVIVGQFFAAIAFSFLLSTTASQISKLLSYVSNQLFTTTTATQRKNQTPVRIPRNLRADASTTPVVQPDLSKLLICVFIDTIGSSSILLPLIGDASDVLWAPTAGLLLRYLFYNSNVILIFEFAEEILPFTDIIPLATLCWIIDTYFRETDIAKLLQLGAYSSSSSSVSEIDRSDAIDVDDNNSIRDGRSKYK